MWDSFEGVFSLDCFTADEAWMRIMPLMREDTREAFKVYGDSVPFDDVHQFIKGSEKSHFSMTNEQFEIGFGTLEHVDLSFLTIRSSSPRSVEYWGKLVDTLRADGFISSRVFDAEAEHWQNAEDPIEFEAAGRDYQHLPMKSNNLPAPLEKQVIDTSQNPGRRILRHGYVEALGGVMWLTQLFFQRTEGDLDKIVGLNDHVSVHDLGNGLIRLTLLSETPEERLEIIRSHVFPLAVT